MVCFGYCVGYVLLLFIVGCWGCNSKKAGDHISLVCFGIILFWVAKCTYVWVTSWTQPQKSRGPLSPCLFVAASCLFVTCLIIQLYVLNVSLAGTQKQGGMVPLFVFASWVCFIVSFTNNAYPTPCSPPFILTHLAPTFQKQQGDRAALFFWPATAMFRT